MARVVIAQLSKTFKGSGKNEICALREINLVVEENELLAIVGPSGSGKSTLLRLIAGLEMPSTGTISIGGRDLAGVAPQDRDIAMVFQNYALYPHLSIYDNLALGLKIRRLPRQEIDQRVRETAALLELSDCLERLPKAVSGGQRQRVALGRAIVRRPKLFLFDEPLSNLDAPMRVQMRAELARLHAQLAATMIYVTHDQVEAMALGRRIAVLNEGALQQVAAPMNLYLHPANRFVAGFIGSPPMNFLAGRLARAGDVIRFCESTELKKPNETALEPLDLELSDRISGSSTRLAPFVGRDLILGIRPEDIVPCFSKNVADAAQSTGALGRKPGEAITEAAEPHGAETHIYLKSCNHRFVARVPGWHQPEAGERVPVVFDMDNAHWFDPITGANLMKQL